MRDAVAVDADAANRIDLLAHLAEKKVRIKTGHCMQGFTDGVLTCTLDGAETKETLDLLVFAGGLRVPSPLVEALQSSSYPYCIIGDCRGPGRFVDATRQGYIAIEKLRDAPVFRTV